jgi:photosystem II stability/assembly factor-like uncharacterized protein
VQRYTASSIAIILSSCMLLACSQGQQNKPTSQGASQQAADPVYDAASWPGTYYGLDVVDAKTAVVYGLHDKSAASVVLRTTDGGATWTGVLRVADPQSAKSDQDIVGVDFADAKTGAAMTEGGAVFTTNDGGTTWTQADAKTLQPRFQFDPEKEFVSFEWITFVDDTHGWAVGTGGPVNESDASESSEDKPLVYLTTDGGATWSKGKVPGDVPPSTLQHVLFVDATNGWAVAGDPDDEETFGLLLHSTDGGANWKRVAVDTKQALTDVYFVDAQHGWVVGQSIDPASDTPGPSQILATSDGGATWTPQAKLPTSLYAVRFADASNGWAVGFDWKIYHTSDGGATWTEQNTQERSAGQTITAPNAAKGDSLYAAFVLPKAGHGWALSDLGIVEFKQ